jgi:SdpC family antimicrobial peptide
MKDRSFSQRLGAISGAVAILTTITLMVHVTRPGLISTASTASAAVTTRHDGETLFAGLYFGDGPVAKMFPEIWESPHVAQQVSQAQKSESWSKTKSEAIAWVRTNDPDFFNRFEQDIQSGDHVRVGQAYKQGAQKLSAYVSSTGVDPNSPEARGGVGVVAVVVAAVAVVVAVYAWMYWSGRSVDGVAQGLQEDVLVNMIAERLAHA